MPQPESPCTEPGHEDQLERRQPLSQTAEMRARIHRLQQALAEKDNQIARLEAEAKSAKADHRQAILRKDERIRGLEDQVGDLTTELVALRQPIVTGLIQYQDGRNSDS